MLVLNSGGVSIRTSNSSRHTGARRCSCVSCKPPSGGPCDKGGAVVADCMLLSSLQDTAHGKWREAPAHATWHAHMWRSALQPLIARRSLTRL